MDAKEAIQYFKEVEFIDKWGPDEAGNGDPLIMQADEARLAAVEALEKQVPKKPIMKEGNNRDLFCSICGARVSDVADRIINSDNLQKYCGVCGQLLDWSSDKE